MTVKRLSFLFVLICGVMLWPHEILAGHKAGESSASQTLSFRTPPYLQFISPDSAVIVWETNSSVKSTLEYGRDGKLDNHVAEAVSRMSHKMTVKGLESGKVYSYRIKTVTGDTESVSKVYEFDTTFNYTIPPVAAGRSPYPNDATGRLYGDAARQIVSRTSITKGYCLIYGCTTGQLAYELAKRSELQVVCVDEDAG